MHLTLDLFYSGIKTLGILKEQYQLLLATCLGLASKLDELDEKIPYFETIQKNICPKSFCSFTRAEMIELEDRLVKALDWNLLTMTTFDFTEILMTLGVLYPSDQI